MRSRRSTLELGCRIGAFALLGWLLGASLMPARGRRVEHARGQELEARLPGWTRVAPRTALHVELSAVPSDWAVDWLAALEHAGHRVSWAGALTPLAVSVGPLTDPRGGLRIDVAAPENTVVTLHDDAGVVDSVHITALGGSVTAPMVVGRVSAVAAPIPRSSAGAARLPAMAETASVAPPAPPVLRPVLVVGRAGWEGKFVAAALEERGWRVVARFFVAPGVQTTDQVGVTTGAGTLALDTAHFAAVVAIDSSVQRFGAALGRYVRSGGGLVLAGNAGGASAVAQLAAGTPGPRTRPAVRSLDTIGRGATGFHPVAALRPGGVPLERRDSGIAVAARRVGAGRVIQTGYDDTWRWRMAGGPQSENAHRLWWTRLVGAVAYVPAAADAAARSGGGAPLVQLVDRLGAARPAPAAAGRWRADPRLLLTLIMILLLVEWGSRRLRGLR